MRTLKTLVTLTTLVLINFSSQNQETDDAVIIEGVQKFTPHITRYCSSIQKYFRSREEESVTKSATQKELFRNARNVSERAAIEYSKELINKSYSDNQLAIQIVFVSLRIETSWSAYRNPLRIQIVSFVIVLK